MKTTGNTGQDNSHLIPAWIKDSHFSWQYKLKLFVKWRERPCACECKLRKEDRAQTRTGLGFWRILI